MAEIPPLPRYVDPRLSKGVVRQEIRSLGNLHDLMERVHGYLQTEVMLPTAKGAKLDSMRIRQVGERVAEDFAALGSCIHVERQRPVRPALASRNYAYVRGHFVQHAGDGTAAIRTLRVRVTPKGCSMSWGGTPITFLDHAAERLVQRLPEDKPRDPLCTIGVVLQEMAGFLVPSLRIADASPDRKLAVPFGDGILLGEVRRMRIDALKVGGFRQEGNNILPSVRLITPSSLGPSDHVGHVTEEILVLMTKTYVGPNELGASRRRFLAMAKDFVARHGHAFEADGHNAMYPGAPRSETMDAIRSGTARRPLGDDAMDAIYAELCAIHADPGFRAGMGSFGPAGDPPRAYWHTGRESMMAYIAEMESRKGLRPWEGTPPPAIGFDWGIAPGR